MAEKEPTLSFNRETGMYEGVLLVQVDAEIFRRLLLRTVEEDATADLTDPQTWVAAVARMGKIANWLDKPYVKITPIAPPIRQVVTPPVEVERDPTPQSDSFVSLREQLKEKARHLPPYLWEEACLPIIPEGLTYPEKQPIYNKRQRSKALLSSIRREWERGTFEIDPAAAEQERQHQQEEQGAFMGKLTVVAEAVNGSRIH